MFVLLCVEKCKCIYLNDLIDIVDFGISFGDFISVMFIDFEKKYGYELVFWFMFYLVGLVIGLSDSEMEDLLLLDDYVMSVIYLNYKFFLWRIFYNKWLWLKDEIDCYFV